MKKIKVLMLVCALGGCSSISHEVMNSSKQVMTTKSDYNVCYKKQEKKLESWKIVKDEQFYRYIRKAWQYSCREKQAFVLKGN